MSCLVFCDKKYFSLEIKSKNNLKTKVESYLKTFFFCKEDTVSPVGGVACPPPPAAGILLPNKPPLVVVVQLGRLCVDETLAMAIFCMPCLMAAQSGSCSKWHVLCGLKPGGNVASLFVPTVRWTGMEVDLRKGLLLKKRRRKTGIIIYYSTSIIVVLFGTLGFSGPYWAPH